MIGLGPTPIVDLRDDLARGDARHQPTQRGRYDIHGVVVHHTAGVGPPEAVAQYHVNTLGWPSIGYHFWVDPDGTVFQLNRVTEIANSQGGRASRSPVPWTRPNKNFLAVVFRGDFTNRDVTPAAKVAFHWLWAALQGSLGIAPDMLFSHREFKATLCPGRAGAVVADLRTRVPAVRDRIPASVEDAQGDLVALGYDLGPYGPAGDGVDGVWGSKSQEALLHLTGSAELSFRSAYTIAEGLSELG